MENKNLSKYSLQNKSLPTCKQYDSVVEQGPYGAKKGLNKAQSSSIVNRGKGYTLEGK